MEIPGIKKKYLIAAIIVMSLIIIVMIMNLLNEGNLTVKNDTITHEAGQELVINAKDYFDVDDEAAAEITFDTSKVDVMKTGEYEATAFYKNKKYTFTVKVTDTKAPKVELAQRYLFINSVADADLSELIETVYDASEYAAKLVRFAPAGNLKVMDEKTLKELADAVSDSLTDEELLAIGTADMPAEAGIYRSVLEIRDVHGNASYEEVYVILDTTGARIEDVPDKVITVSKENLSAEPPVDKNDYTITDNVDGVISADKIICSLELKSGENCEWLVHVSYTDRAGNESKAEFLITVQEEKNDTGNSQNGNTGDKNDTEDKNNSSDKNNASDKNNSSDKNETSDKNNNADKNDTDKEDNKKPSDDKNDSSDKNNTSDKNDSSNKNDSSDKNDTLDKDDNKKPSNNQDVSTWVPNDDENDISPYEQMVIDAGYGNVVEIRENVYAVLVHMDTYFNGQKGNELLRNWLADRGLEPGELSGAIIDSDNDWYWYIAEKVREIDTSGNDWNGDGEIEFID